MLFRSRHLGGEHVGAVGGLGAGETGEAQLVLVAKDLVLLEGLINGVLEVDDSVYVVFTGPDGTRLAAKSKRQQYPDKTIAESLAHSRATDVTITSFTVDRDQRSEQLYDFAVVIQGGNHHPAPFPPLSFESELLQAESSTAVHLSPHSYGIVQIGLTGEQMNQALYRIIGNVVLITIVVILSGISATVLLTRRITTPLKSLVAVADRKSTRLNSSH